MILTIWTIISLSADRTGANVAGDEFPRIGKPILVESDFSARHSRADDAWASGKSAEGQ